MSNFIITSRRNYFEKIGNYNYCSIYKLANLPDLISYDSETESLSPRHGKLFAIQLGSGNDNFLIDIETIPFSKVQPYLEDKILVMHNACFDLGWLYKENFFPKKVRDTFIASKIMNNGLVSERNGFGYVMERELGLIYDKSEQKNIHKIKLSTDKAIQYCFNDVDRLLDLNTVLEEKIDEGGYRETYELHCRYIRALAYMEQCGMPLNYDLWKKKMALDEIELKEKKIKVIEYIYDNITECRDIQIDMFDTTKRIKVMISSPKQMITVFKKLGINVIDPSDAEKESINENILKQTKHEFVDIWLDYQGIVHDVSTYGENVLNKIQDNYIYTTFNPILDTARISTRKEGVNILNFPANKKTRECVEAHPGYKYIVCDYEGQETKTGADITDDQAMIDSIVNNSCLHCAFTRVLNPTLKDLSDEVIIKDYKDLRQASKAPRFCFQFGGGAYTLAQNEGIPIEEAEVIEKAYRELHSGIYRYGNEKIKEVIQKGYIESTAGFKLHLPYFEDFRKKHQWLQSLDQGFWRQYKEGKIEYKSKLKAEENKEAFKITNIESYNLYTNNSKKMSDYFKNKSKYFKLVLNNPTQTTAAHQSKEAASLIFEYIEKHNHFWKARISNICHDEFNLEVVDELVDEYNKVVEESMINGGNKYLTKGYFVMTCSSKASSNWYLAK